MTEKLSTSVRYLEKQVPMMLEDFRIESFEVPHDGTDNVGYCIEIDGKVFSFLTDLGEITPTAANYISKANYLILEANYDEEMLKMGPYPQYLKERIMSRTGHMSNSATAEFLAENITCLLYTSNHINIICWELNILHWLQQISITTLVYYL